MLYNFYPGPSKIYPEVGTIFQEAIANGVFEYNHRSPQFAQIFDHTRALLRNKLLIPQEYEIFFLSSATECWQMISQSFVKRTSTHIYNGAFGKKWMERAQSLGYETYDFVFGINESIAVDQLKIPANTELIAVTQNETSNGTQISNSTLAQLRTKFADELIAVDATSSMGGVFLQWENADIWYSSVQKCFGMPAGLSVMVCSPKAINKAKIINYRSTYNNFVDILLNADKSQTTHTPNIPAIYTIGKVLESKPDIASTHKTLLQRRDQFLQQIDGITGLGQLITNEEVQSDTVFCLQADPAWIENKNKQAADHNILLGKGYGEWKGNTIRIANFPAIPDSDFAVLIDFLNK